MLDSAASKTARPSRLYGYRPSARFDEKLEEQVVFKLVQVVMHDSVFLRLITNERCRTLRLVVCFGPQSTSKAGKYHITSDQQAPVWVP